MCLTAAVEEPGMISVSERVVRYLAARREWLRTGGIGDRPASRAYDLSISEMTLAICELEAEFRELHGLGSWKFYEQTYYDAMMAVRREAVAKGEDPDAAAISFTKRFYNR